VRDRLNSHVVRHVTMCLVLLLREAACSDCCVAPADILKAGIEIIVMQFPLLLANTLTL